MASEFAEAFALRAYDSIHLAAAIIYFNERKTYVCLF
jgi:hypothetical protein